MILADAEEAVAVPFAAAYDTTDGAKRARLLDVASQKAVNLSVLRDVYKGMHIHTYRLLLHVMTADEQQRILGHGVTRGTSSSNSSTPAHIGPTPAYFLSL